MQLYDVKEIRAYDSRETETNAIANVEVPSHGAFMIRSTEDGNFFIRAISAKTPVIKPSEEPGLAGLPHTKDIER